MPEFQLDIRLVAQLSDEMPYLPVHSIDQRLLCLIYHPSCLMYQLRHGHMDLNAQRLTTVSARLTNSLAVLANAAPSFQVLPKYAIDEPKTIPVRIWRDNVSTIVTTYELRRVDRGVDSPARV